MRGLGKRNMVPVLRTWSGAGLVLWFLAACNSDCALVEAPAIRVEVVDAVSGESLALGSLVVAEDGAFADSVRIPESFGNPDVQVSLAFGRPGRYRVTVERPGFRPWVLSNVRVARGGSCGRVKTVSLRAELERLREE